MSIELWKSSLLTMPDSSFYELIHSALGKIKTPFNKQQLLKDLESFLKRKDIQKAITAYIDADDAKVIAAVSLFGNPTQKELENFFIGEYSFMQLYDIIVNLEERFILYRIRDKLKLALNPVLENELARFTEDVSALFPPESLQPKGDKKTKSESVLNDCIIAGLLSFVSAMEETPFYKKEGQLRKQVIAAAKTCFPDLNLEEALGALKVLGLFHNKDEYLIPDKTRFEEFALLPPRERMEYCAAAMLVFKEQVHNALDIQSSYYKNRVKEAFNVIHLLIDFLAFMMPSENYYPEKNIIKLAWVIKSRTEANININVLMEVIKKTGLNCKLCIVNYKLPCITIDSGFSIFVYPQINFSDAVTLAGFLNIKETGAVVRFELEKDSAVRAFNNNITSGYIIDTLDKLSGKKTAESIVWNLKDWEKRYREVSLKRGMVLMLSKDKQYLAETGPLSSLITETLAHGVYLLNEATEEEAAAALNNAGIDIIARKKSPTACDAKSEKNSRYKSLNYFSSAALSSSFFPKARTAKTKDKKTASPKVDAQALKKDLLAILEKMPLDKADRDVLSSRIERRLILCEAQLKEASIRYEKLEARNMDYTGKLNIAKQAIAQDCPVEVVIGRKQIYGIPRALEKEGENGGYILVIAADDTADNYIRMPLAKISLLRRIKKSIFEG